jgi:hypothetical protein
MPETPKPQAAIAAWPRPDAPPLSAAGAGRIVAEVLDRRPETDIAALAGELIRAAGRLRAEFPVAAANGELLAAVLARQEGRRPPSR